MRFLPLLSVVPLAAAVAVAGSVSSPSKVRPCVEEHSEGITGNPTHLILGGDGDLYAAEEDQRRILKFDPDTGRTRYFGVKLEPHDLTAGPDGRIWFVSYIEDRFGALDPRTGKVTLEDRLARDSEPHMVRFSNDGRLYITEQKAGAFARFDPETGELREGSFGLPRGNYIHNIVKVPNGDFWAVLQEGDQLARFSLSKQRFDKFVPIPLEDSGPRDITYVRSRNAVFATLFAANQLAEYDLDTGKLTLHPTHLEPLSYATAISRQPKPKLTFVRPDAQEKALWVATLAGGELLRFDLKTHETERVGCGITLPAAPLGIATDRKGRLWFNEVFPKGRLALVKQ